jgi:hypothetical protein
MELQRLERLRVLKNFAPSISAAAATKGAELGFALNPRPPQNAARRELNGPREELASTRLIVPNATPGKKPLGIAVISAYSKGRAKETRSMNNAALDFPCLSATRPNKMNGNSAYARVLIGRASRCGTSNNRSIAAGTASSQVL